MHPRGAACDADGPAVCFPPLSGNPMQLSARGRRAALAVGARLCAWQGSPTSQPRDRAFAFFRTAVKKVEINNYMRCESEFPPRSDKS